MDPDVDPDVDPDPALQNCSVTFKLGKKLSSEELAVIDPSVPLYRQLGFCSHC